MIQVHTRLHPSIVTVTMDRPEKRNALNAELVTALRNAVDEHGSSETTRVIVLAGAGSAFSAGADLDELRQLQGATFEQNHEDSRRLAGLFDAIRSCPVPVIARVHGPAIAGGCGLAAVCDFSIAAQTAKFGFPEVRIGFVPAIVSVYLVRRLPGATVRDLLLGGRVLDAREACRIGLVGRCVPGDELDGAVLELASGIARDTSREAVCETKRLLRDLDELPYTEALAEAARRNAKAREGADCRAGVTAFLDRVDAPWRAAWEED